MNAVTAVGRKDYATGYGLQTADCSERQKKGRSVRNNGAEHFVACFVGTVTLSASLIKRYQPHITYYYYYYYYYY
jgi:hypothetical protein